MENFVRIGQILEGERIKQGVSMEEIFHKLKIKKEYVRAMENGTIPKHIPCVYYLGYIRNYCALLGINHDKLLELARSESTLNEKEGNLQKAEQKKQSLAHFAIEPSKKLIAGCIIAFIVVLALFLNLTDQKPDQEYADLYSKNFIKEIGANSIIQIDPNSTKTTEELEKISERLDDHKF
jgi:cytoskeletal protein RodZ